MSPTPPRGGGRGPARGPGGRRRGQASGPGRGRGGPGRGPGPHAPRFGSGPRPAAGPGRRPAAPQGPIAAPHSRDHEIERLRQLAESIEQQKARLDGAISRIEPNTAGQAGPDQPPVRRPTSRKALVDPDACTGCALCLDVCPVDAIIVVDRTAAVTDDCIGCAACLDECPNNALSIAGAP